MIIFTPKEARTVTENSRIQLKFSQLEKDNAFSFFLPPFSGGGGRRYSEEAERKKNRGRSGAYMDANGDVLRERDG